MSAGDDVSSQGDSRALKQLMSAEWAAGVAGLKLFVGCVVIASFMMGAVWILGGGLSTLLARGGPTFLGGDMAVTTTNVALPDETRASLRDLGTVSEVAELRSSVRMNDARTAIELKAVDGAYPLYGEVALASGRPVQEVLRSAGDLPAALVDPALLTRLQATVGDRMRIGDAEFVIQDVILTEPDRLATGRFMVGPRVLISDTALIASNLIQPGSLIEYRYRLRESDATPSDLLTALDSLKPDAGWELETPADAGDRVLRTVERTTTFLGVAGIVAFAIGLSGAWAAARAWLQRRSRTIALYRLSGATPDMVFKLHTWMMGLASGLGLAMGLSGSVALAMPILTFITERLHVTWQAADVLDQLIPVLAILSVGLIGAGLLALSGVKRLSPGAAMRSGDAPLQSDPEHVRWAAVLLALALAGAGLSLPVPVLAGAAIIGFILATALIAGGAAWLSSAVARRNATGFVGTILVQSIGNAGQTVPRAVAIGIGILGITAMVAAQGSLNRALTLEIPDRAPDLVLIDIQPTQVDAVRERILSDENLDGLQTHPFMRMTLLEVNGVAVQDALLRDDKSWVIEGDRSFSWTVEPTGAELLQGEWWDADYSGPPLVSPEEDIMDAFDLKVGDRVTYSVLGRVFTSEVANIRKEYHRTFRPESLMVASPEPFRNAPHTWIMSLQGETDPALDSLIRELASDHPNVTSIDVRPIVTQVRGVIDGATLASVAIAALLVIAGALSVAALVASDVDAKRRESVVFSLVGASRREIALARFGEAAALGTVAALLGGAAGLLGGYLLVTLGLRIPWSPDALDFLTPAALAIAASLVAGIVGGLGGAPKGRGQMARLLTS